MCWSHSPFRSSGCAKLDDFIRNDRLSGYAGLHRSASFPESGGSFIDTDSQVLNNIHSLADKTISPLQSIANKLHPLVNYLILPLFAFVNAGVTGDIGIGSLPESRWRYSSACLPESRWYFPVHLLFLSVCVLLRCRKVSKREPIWGVDVGRYRFYGSSLYREPVFADA
ncbi:MAG: Na+/H+ antiporter NhaA [Parabacteroides merdae]